MAKCSVIDRREVAKKRSSGNRQRFLRRIKKSIKERALDIIGDSVANAQKSSDVSINQNTIEEPQFVYDDVLFHTTIILPGNYKYVKGDVFDLSQDRGENGQGTGSEGGQGDGQDDFVVNVSKEEFFDYFFEDLELPNLEKKQETKIVETVNEHAGFVPVGPPNRLAVVRSLTRAKMRRIALTSKWRKKLRELEEELSDAIENDMMEEKKRIELEISKCKTRIRAILFLDDVDLQFRVNEPRPVKKADAVIFFLMDNSGSMEEEHKTIARKFFSMFYAFVSRRYDKPEIVFINHTETAKEVDEDYFFANRDSGGTMVSSAYDLAAEIIKKHYNPAVTNIYISHATDGDNYSHDNETAIGILRNKLLPLVQHMSYLEVRIGNYGMGTQRHEYWDMLHNANFKNLAMQEIESEEDIFKVFRKFFSKKSNQG